MTESSTPPLRWNPPLVEARCSNCPALLFKGVMVGEIKCRNCGHINSYNRLQPTLKTTYNADET